MFEAIEVCLQIVLGIAFPALVIKKDLRRLSPRRLERAWNDASLWSAIVSFGPLSLIVHFTRTRRSLLGLVLGFAWAIAHVSAALFSSWLFRAAAGVTR